MLLYVVRKPKHWAEGSSAIEEPGAAQQAVSAGSNGGNAMSLLTALAISIGGLGGLATWVCLGMVTGLQIWAIFIAWACFYHCGGAEAGLKNTIICNIAGAVLAWIASDHRGQYGRHRRLAAGRSVGGHRGRRDGRDPRASGQRPGLRDDPGDGLRLCLGGGVLPALGRRRQRMAADFTNPLITVVVSMVIGAILGYVSQKIGVALSSSGKRATAVAQRTAARPHDGRADNA